MADASRQPSVGIAIVAIVIGCAGALFYAARMAADPIAAEQSAAAPVIEDDKGQTPAATRSRGRSRSKSSSTSRKRKTKTDTPAAEADNAIPAN